MKARSAIKIDLFAEEQHRKKIEALGDPLSEIESHIDFAALAVEIDRVEQPFAAIAQMGGKLIRTIGQARASFAMAMMAACYNLKLLVYFHEAGIKAL